MHRHPAAHAHKRVSFQDENEEKEKENDDDDAEVMNAIAAAVHPRERRKVNDEGLKATQRKETRERTEHKALTQKVKKGGRATIYRPFLIGIPAVFLRSYMIVPRYSQRMLCSVVVKRRENSRLKLNTE